MKKSLLFLILTAFVLLVSCKQNESSVKEFSDLSESSKSLKISTNRVNSIFNPFQVFLSKPIGKEIVDSISGDIIKIEIDSVSLRSNIGSSRNIPDGSFELNSETSLTYTPGRVLFLDETYVLRVYFNYFIKIGNAFEQLTDYGTKYDRSLWLEYTPTIVNGVDVKYLTSKTGESSEINVYDGDIIIDIISPAMFNPESAPAGTNIALRFKSISIKGNKSTDETGWEMITDSSNIKFTFNPILPEGANHLFPGLFYTVNTQFYYMEKKGNNWVHVFDEMGDTIIWDSNHSFGTTDLFVPSQIISKLVGVDIPENVRNRKFTANITIDSLPELRMNVSNLVEIEQNGIIFKPVLDEFSLLKNKKNVNILFNWINKNDRPWADKDSLGATIEPDSLYLVPGGNYLATAIAHWEYKKGDEWFKIFADDTLKRENIGVYINSDIPDMPTIVSSITPENKFQEANMRAEIGFNLNFKHNAEVSYKGFTLRNTVKEFKILTGGQLISENFVLENDLMSGEMVLDSMLLPNVEYVASTVASWEYVDKDGLWKEYTNDGKNADENKNSTFKTMNVPAPIVNRIYPRGSSVDLSSNLFVELNYPLNEEIVFNGVVFKAFIDDVSIRNNENFLDFVKNDWINDTLLRIDPIKYFIPGMAHSVKVLAHWEYKDFNTNEFKPIYEADSFRVEGIASKGFRTEGYPVDEIFGQMTPVDTSIAVDSIPVLEILYPENTLIEHAGTEFKAVVDSFVMFNTTDEFKVEATISWNEERNAASLMPAEVLGNGKNYTLTAGFHWEWKNEEGIFIIIESSRMSKSVNFKTDSQ